MRAMTFTAHVRSGGPGHLLPAGSLPRAALRPNDAPNYHLVPVLLALALVTARLAVAAHPGDLDPSFGSGGAVTTTGFGTSAVGASAVASAVALQPDGKIVAVGFSQTPATQPLFTLERYNTDGSLDPTFGTGGTVTTALATSAGA